MTDEDMRLPAVLVEAHAADFCVEHDGHDFQPYERFLWSVEMTEWWQDWTGMATVGAAPFRAFGQDGAGGLAAFWCRTSDEPLDHQPIVFIGSAGEHIVIARDLGDYLWLLANGVGPLETVDGIDRVPEPIGALTAIAHRYTGSERRSIPEVLGAARSELPALEALINASAEPTSDR